MCYWCDSMWLNNVTTNNIIQNEINNIITNIYYNRMNYALYTINLLCNTFL